jgi:hypothetical protein
VSYKEDGQFRTTKSDKVVAQDEVKVEDEAEALQQTAGDKAGIKRRCGGRAAGWPGARRPSVRATALARRPPRVAPPTAGPGPLHRPSPCPAPAPFAALGHALRRPAPCPGPAPGATPVSSRSYSKL